MCSVVNAGRPIGTRAVTCTQWSLPQSSVTDWSVTQSGSEFSAAAVADRPSMAARAPSRAAALVEVTLEKKEQDDDQRRYEADELDVEDAALVVAQHVQETP